MADTTTADKQVIADTTVTVAKTIKRQYGHSGHHCGYYKQIHGDSGDCNNIADTLQKHGDSEDCNSGHTANI